MATEVKVKKRYNHPTYTDEEIDALLEYFKYSGLELKPFLDRFD
ncbi:MAG: hypothetical protein ACREAY_00265 [Nitrososphaera sp.]